MRLAARLQVAAVIGLSISIYAVYVEHNNVEDPSYEAMCDINEHMSCSRVAVRYLWIPILASFTTSLPLHDHQVLTSEWSHVLSHLGIVPRGSPLDLGNAAYGILYFSLVLLHEALPLASYRAKARLVFAVSVLVVALSAYLGYILAAVLKDVCLVCISLYVVNAYVLVLSYRGMQRANKGD